MQRGTGSGTGVARARVVAVVVSLVVVLVLVLVLSTVVLVRSLLPGSADCTVTVGDRTVELGRDAAEDAATAAARGVRDRAALSTTTARVARLDLSDQDAGVVAAALTGRSRHALTCRYGGADADEESDRLGPAGLTGRAADVRRDLDRAFGRQRVGGFVPGGVTTGHTPGSAHYQGRAVDVFFRPVNARNTTRGWATAQYLVAHAERLSVTTVIFDGRIWTDRRSWQGWRRYQPDTSGRSPRAAAVLQHRDHVHVDVAD